MTLILKISGIFGVKFCSYFCIKKNYHRYRYNSSLSNRQNIVLQLYKDWKRYVQFLLDLFR